jgi:ornithine cyclodeaminase
VFDSVGFAIEDFSALRYLQAAAQAHSLGQALDLIPQLADPKDLYQLVKPLPAAPTASTTSPAKPPSTATHAAAIVVT